MIKYFFDVPVYRLSEQEYYLEEKNHSKKLYEYIYTRIDGTKRNPLVSYEKFYEESSIFRDMWRYNEIIGYIRLYILGTQIRGEYFQHKSKRIVKTRKKSFIYITHKLVSEINIMNQTNDEIYNSILQYLERCEKELEKKYIDIVSFKSIGQYVNWNKLIDDNK
ncbi:MAG: hypothetical protein RBQ84_10145 [Arcobacter sp.]|jgi:hypothetical protein|uniref:hypothetical protein n=2 Tax=Arcobacter sp. TaxID=1872629 RepID=UPI002A75645F|nr:hypothetical protein [Arcobacter sp.]MDY3201301.1 hypothetical protein [Arcobacter sp.]